MDEEVKVLISRTRVNKERWDKLSHLSEILTRVIGKEVTKERLVDLAIESLLNYYKERFEEANELESEPVREEEILRSAMPRPRGVSITRFGNPDLDPVITSRVTTDPFEDNGSRFFSTPTVTFEDDGSDLIPEASDGQFPISTVGRAEVERARVPQRTREQMSALLSQLRMESEARRETEEDN